ncbi:ATP-binding cassette domain-containing protein [soil metagenome]
MTLELRDIHKHFGPVRANDGVDLHVASGHLHGLLGENGAGKSTLMKVLSGFYAPDSGSIALDGVALELGSPGAAVAAGIGMLHQDPLLFLPMSVLDNVLFASPGPLALARRRDRRTVTELRDRFGFGFDLDAPARTLTVGERQQVEITRLLWLGARVLILDEPTTGISADQRELLFATLRELASEGMSVIFVSHKLEEVEELCGEVTVMRRGQVVGRVAMPVPPSELVTLMFGEPIEPAARQDLDLGDGVLAMRAVTIDERLTRLQDITLDVAAGEVIGLAGMEGSGQGTFLRGICGLASPSSGTITVDGVDVTSTSYRARIGLGVGYLPAGRLEEGLVEGLTIAEHLVLADRRRGGFFIDRGRADDEAHREIERYAIKGSAGSPVESLSGGNQQRLLLAMLPAGLRLLLMEHPTRGLDIGSADWVWGELLARREHGTAIIFASADLDELLRYSDRILVFFSGAIIAELDARATDLDGVGHLIGGRTESHASAGH